MERHTLISEARARIIWGESPSGVREFLISEGISDAEAGERIREFRRERSAEIRRRGITNACIGLACLGVAGILVYLAVGGPEFGGDFHGLAVAAVAGFYGLWRLITGVIYLLRPQSEDRPMDEVPG